MSVSTRWSVFGLEAGLIDALREHDNDACVPAWIGQQPGWEAWARCCPLHPEHKPQGKPCSRSHPPDEPSPWLGDLKHLPAGVKLGDPHFLGSRGSRRVRRKIFDGMQVAGSASADGRRGQHIAVRARAKMSLVQQVFDADREIVHRGVIVHAPLR